MSTSLNRTCLVTGASSGIGLEVSLSLLRAGHNVVGVSRRGFILQNLEDSWPCQFIGVEHDLTIPGLGDKLGQLPEPYLNIDLCVHSAGCARQGVVLSEMSDIDIAEQINSNVLGLTFTLRDAARYFIERRRGTLIVIGSIAAEDSAPDMAVYAATKAFTRQLVRSLRTDLHGRGIRISCIEPGTTRTPLLDGQPGGLPQVRYNGFQPLEPSDIGDMVRWIYDAPAHVNIQEVQVLPVDQAMYVRGIHRRTVQSGEESLERRRVPEMQCRE